jgi:hypothetical protein
LAKQEYIRMLQTFRPTQTVFETGIGTGCLPQSSSTKMSGGNSKNAAALLAAANSGRGRHAEAADAMRSFRKASAWHLERNRVTNHEALQAMSSQFSSKKEAQNDSGNAEDGLNEDDEAEDYEVDEDSEAGHDMGDSDYDSDDYLDADDNDDNDNDDGIDTKAPILRRTVKRVQQKKLLAASSGNSVVSWAESAAYVPSSQIKKRISISERRRMKKLGVQISYNAMQDDEDDELAGNPKRKAKKSLSSELLTDKAAGFQDPRFYMAYGTEDTSATFSEEAMQPMANLRSSETFGASTADKHTIDFNIEDAEAQKKKKLMRWDPKKRKFVKQTLEEMAQARKSGLKRIRSEAGVSGMSISSKASGALYEEWKKKRKREINDDAEDDEDWRRRPNMRVNMDVKDEIRRPEQIKKLVAKRADMKLKNTEKGKRRKIEDAMRRKKKGPSSSPGGSNGGGKKGRR